MLTLQHINLTEEELGAFLNFLFEGSDEQELYEKFIGEATLDQKLGLLEKEAIDTMLTEESPEYKTKHIRKGIMSSLGTLLGPFWVAKRAIQAMKDKCSRKCSIGGLNTFMRQKCMAECHKREADAAVTAATKISCAGNKQCDEKKKGLIQKYKEKAAKAANKALAYKEKHKKVRFTV